MNTSALSDIAKVIESLAVVVGGGWAYWQFVVRRESEPATDLDVDLSFVGVQNGQWIVQVCARHAIVITRCTPS
jgi:hypothetical protein